MKKSSTDARIQQVMGDVRSLLLLLLIVSPIVAFAYSQVCQNIVRVLQSSI